MIYRSDDIPFYCFNYGNKQYKKESPNQIGIMLGKEDNTGDNISHLNYCFGQTTGIYWVWKNVDKPVIGLNTYRLFWNESEFNSLDFDKNTLVIPNPVEVNSAIDNPYHDRYNILTHFNHCHGEIGMSLLYGLCNIYELPIKPHMIDQLKTQTKIHPFNMFIASKETMNTICNILFSVLNKYYENYQYVFSTIESYTGQNRILDFLAERILHIIYTNASHFLPDIKVKNVSIINLPH